MNPSFKIDYDKIPSHIGIIMDGNGRWAKQRNWPKLAGHKAGMETLKKIVRLSGEIGVSYLTVYAFSTENWKRPEDEITGIFQILIYYMEREIKEIHDRDVKVNMLGDYSELPPQSKAAVDKAVELTKNNQGLQFNIALNYGGRNEIIGATKQIAIDLKNGKIEESEITEELFNRYLFTNGMPDPDFIIRTSGELRLSNFLPYQSAYSEFFFTDVLWPDFNEEQYLEAILDYQNRKRNFGGRE